MERRPVLLGAILMLAMVGAYLRWREPAADAERGPDVPGPSSDAIGVRPRAGQETLAGDANAASMERVVVQESAGAAPEPTESVVPWNELPRTSSDVGRLAAFNLAEVALRRLLRHESWNPNDTEIPEVAWLAAEEELAPLLAKAATLQAEEVRIGNEEMHALVATGVVSGLPENREQVDGGVLVTPNAALIARTADTWGLVSQGGNSYAFTLSDLPRTLALAQQREKVTFDYLAGVGAFLQRIGVGSPAETIAVLESFQRHSRTLR